MAWWCHKVLWYHCTGQLFPPFSPPKVEGNYRTCMLPSVLIHSKFELKGSDLNTPKVNRRNASGNGAWNNISTVVNNSELCKYFLIYQYWLVINISIIIFVLGDVCMLDAIHTSLQPAKKNWFWVIQGPPSPPETCRQLTEPSFFTQIKRILPS